MILYTCGTKTVGPGFAHPCAKAGNALDAAGYEYEIKVVGGYRLTDQGRALITALEPLQDWARQWAAARVR